MSTVASDMKVTREDVNPCTVRLTIVCTPEQVRAGFDRALKTLGKKVRVPGFRPGHAPKKMVEDALNPQALYEEAAENIVRRAFDEALAAQDIKSETTPRIELNKLEKDTEECEFTAQIGLQAVVELADTKGLKATKPKLEVTDEEINRTLDDMRARSANRTPQAVTDRGVASGDVVVVNLKAEGAEEEGKQFMVMAGQTFPALDEALMGMHTEEVKAVTLEYPANFRVNESWAGKTLPTQVMVKSISAVQLPELDDEFAKSLNTENVDDLKEKIREGIMRAKENGLQEMLRDQLLDDLLAKSNVHVSDNTWQAVVDRRLQEMARELSNQRKTIEDYVKETGLTNEEFKARLDAEAQLNVRRAVVIQKIFTDNDMKITDEDVSRHFLQIAAENGVPQNELDNFAKQFGGQLREEVIFRSMAHKVADLLLESADVTEGDLVSVEAEAPKKAAKRTKKSDAK